MIVSVKDLYLMKQDTQEGKEFQIQGWVKANRSGKKIGFLEVNDGSTISCVQVVYPADQKDFDKLSSLTTGAAIDIIGTLVWTKKPEQPFELKCKTLNYASQPENNYPIQKKAHSYEFLRENADLRARTNTFFSVFKIRSQAAFAVHEFFNKNNFLYLNSPIITANDAEGAGENFVVTTLENNEYQKDFFGRKAYLTVSGQLNAEAYSQSFKKVYTFGPTFRAENSNTTRHAAEFWMIEPEVAFANLQDNIVLAKSLLISVCQNVLINCEKELNFLTKKHQDENNTSHNLIDSLKKLTDEKAFNTVTYTEVVSLLEKAKSSGKQFVFNDIKWGMDLQSEHERYICEEVYQGPTFVINYPKAIKAFYMKQNADSNTEQKTVAAMDLLIPNIGELIGGSQREDSYEQLLENKKEFGITDESLDWYLTLRKSGYAPSSGFGIGFERLVMLLTGMNNIRDVLSFPRTPQNLMF